MGFSSYAAYCASDLWRTIRGSVIVLAGGTCQVCQERPAVIVHHLVYDLATLKGENMDGLMAVCEPCHAFAHKKPRRGYTGNHRAKQQRLSRRQRRRRKLWTLAVQREQTAKPILAKHRAAIHYHTKCLAHLCPVCEGTAKVHGNWCQACSATGIRNA
jgi:hypothetical protein